MQTISRISMALTILTTSLYSTASWAHNPIPQFTGLRVMEVNHNYDSTTSEDTNSYAWDGYLAQKLYDSPVNGPGHEWTVHIQALHRAEVSEAYQDCKPKLRRDAFIEGNVRVTKKHPKAVTLTGRLVVMMRVNQPRPSGISSCVATGEFEFLEDSQKRGFYRLWQDSRTPPCVFEDGTYIQNLGYVDLMTRPRRAN